MNEVCYFCGKESKTREHVPPKIMFRGFECDSITVPSCIIHNCSKSGEDQAVVSTLLLSLKNYIEKSNINCAKTNADVHKAVKIASSTFIRTKNRVVNKPFLTGQYPASENLPEIAFLKEPIKISNWIVKLTAALIYSGTEFFDSDIDWTNLVCWSPNYFDSKTTKHDDDKINLLYRFEDKRKRLERNNWIKGWSAYPREYPENIYCFYIYLEDKEILIKHIFYKNYTWYCWFKPSKETFNKVMSKINGALKS